MNSPCKDNLKSCYFSTSAIRAKGQKSCIEKVKKFSQIKITEKKSFRTICTQPGKHSNSRFSLFYSIATQDIPTETYFILILKTRIARLEA